MNRLPLLRSRRLGAIPPSPPSPPPPKWGRGESIFLLIGTLFSLDGVSVQDIPLPSPVGREVGGEGVAWRRGFACWIAQVVLVISLVSCSHETQKTEKTATPVRVFAVENFTPRMGDRYSASVEPARQVNLTFRVSGFVQYLHQIRAADGHIRSLEPGDMVPAGTVLARLRQEDYEIQVKQAQGQLDAARENEKAARAQVGQAQAASGRAQADFTRAKALSESQSLTQTDFDAAKAQNDSTGAQVEAARAQLEAAVAQLHAVEAALASAQLAQQDTSVVAPFSAAVVQRNIELGALVGPSLSAFSLADLSSVKAAFGVPDMVAVHLKRGAALPIFAEALPGREFRGVVTAVAAVADSNTRLFQVQLTVPNPKAVLKPGMIATLSLGSPSKAEPVPVVPLSAVVRPQEGATGFAVMVVEGNQARRRAVAVGKTYGDRIAVVRGVKLGERVVTSGATFIAEGDNVEVIP
jgi:RND family efflux transporter MFP subunit